MRIAIITRQITNYHHARFEAAAQLFEACSVLSMANQGKFSQVLYREEAKAYEVHRIYPDMETYLAAAGSGELYLKMMQCLNEVGPDVVAVPGWASPECFAGIKWAKRHGARVVLMSDSQAHDAQRSAIRERIKARVVSRCDAALVAGTPHLKYVVQLGMNEDRVFLGYDVVNNNHFTVGAEMARSMPYRYRVQLGLPDRYIMASARFVPKKNLHRLVQAYAGAVSQSADSPDLLIIGDGEGRGSLENLVNSLGLQGRISMPGFFEYADLPAVYGLAEAFVHVPMSEQWGLVVNEAAASSLPLLLSRACGAASELLEEERGGWLVDAGELGSIQHGLVCLISSSAENLRQMGAHNGVQVREWGPERFANSLKAAATAAQIGPPTPLNFIDHILFKAIGYRPIEKVQ